MPKVLVVDDDRALADMMRAWLQNSRYITDVVYDGSDALQLLSMYEYDLLILDWELPGTDGIGICTAYRQGGGISPILFLTGRADLQSKVKGLDAGADDYLPKPFEFVELLARVNALLRRQPELPAQAITVGELKIELQLRSASLGSKKITLSAREFAVLEFLMRNAERKLSSKEILENVWPADSECSEDTVRSTIRHLRKKLGPDGCGQIQTVGRGYVLSAEDNSSGKSEAGESDAAE